MPSLQVREMPAALYGTLQEQARYEHRSIAQQAIVSLARGLNVPDDQHERRQALMKTIKESKILPNGLNLPDSTAMVNEDRNR